MRAEIVNKRGDRIYVNDSATFDRYIADGWSVLSITHEENENGKSTTNEKRPNEARQKRRRATLLHRVT